MDRSSKTKAMRCKTVCFPVQRGFRTAGKCSFDILARLRLPQIFPQILSEVFCYLPKWPTSFGYSVWQRWGELIRRRRKRELIPQVPTSPSTVLTKSGVEKAIQASRNLGVRKTAIGTRLRFSLVGKKRGRRCCCPLHVVHCGLLSISPTFSCNFSIFSSNDASPPGTARSPAVAGIPCPCYEFCSPPSSRNAIYSWLPSEQPISTASNRPTALPTRGTPATPSSRCGNMRLYGFQRGGQRVWRKPVLYNHCER